MRIGKVPENVLRRSVLRQIKTKNTEVEIGAGLGEDCAVFSYSGAGYLAVCMQEAVITTDTGDPADTTIAQLIQRCANNLAAGRAELKAVLISLILPVAAEESELKHLMAEAEKKCASLSAEIAGGQTRTSSAVTEPVAVVTGYGRYLADRKQPEPICPNGEPEQNLPFPAGTLRSIGRAAPGQDIVLSKWIGLEGTALLARRNREKLLARYPAYLVEEAAGFDRYLSVVPEAAAAVKSGVCAMHDVSEGGIFGALRELAEKAGVGLTIDMKKLPLRQETVEICEFCRANPYELLSGGCLLMTTEDGSGLVAALAAKDIPAAIVGKVTEGNDRILVNDDEIRYLDRASQDAVYRLPDADGKHNERPEPEEIS